MPFVRTNPGVEHEGHLRCDSPGCDTETPTFRMLLGPLPFEGWDGIPRREQMRTVVEYFCPDHAEVARRTRD